MSYQRLLTLTSGPPHGDLNTRFDNRGEHDAALRDRFREQLIADKWVTSDEAPTEWVSMHLGDTTPNAVQPRIDVLLKVKGDHLSFYKQHEEQHRHHVVLVCNTKFFPDYRIRLSSHAEYFHTKALPQYIKQALEETKLDPISGRIKFTPPPQVFISTIRFKQIMRYNKNGVEMMITVVREAEEYHTQVMLMSRRIEELLKQNEKDFREMEEAVQVFFDEVRRMAEVPWKMAFPPGCPASKRYD